MDIHVICSLISGGISLVIIISCVTLSAVFKVNIKVTFKEK